MRAYWAVLIVLGLQMSPLAAADKNEAPKPLPPKIVQAWRDAGANVGWMNMNLHLPRHLFEAEGEAKIPREWWDRPRAVPVFQFSEWEEGVLVKLSDPGAPFGLCLNLTKVTDAGLKELAGLKSLQLLNLGGSAVTDAGLKEVGRLKNLQSLIMWGTQVTDVGVKELYGLKNLRNLELLGTKVTDAGLAGLQKDLPKAGAWK
jgi:internalin A